MAGHVFVTRGDLTALACAAWVVPGSHRPSGPHVRPHWLTRPSGLREQFDRGYLRDPDAVPGFRRIWRLRRPPGEGAPQAYLMDSGGTGESLGWYLDGLDEFLRALRHDGDLWRRAGVKRERPLVGIPVFGTGAGGAKQTRGEVIKAVLERLYDAAEDRRLGADLALVTYHEDDHAAAQWARRMLAVRDPWRELHSTELAGVAERLALEAQRERLVLFIGAGISTGAGLPGWKDMIGELADQADIGSDVRADLEELPIIDQARYVESRLHELGKTRLQEAIVELMRRASRCSLSHILLAALPVREVVTTNYDELFELASEGAGMKSAQLPYRPDRDAARWILKLHGTVSEADTIVVTREDYLGYNERRAALAGIVQGLLITKHMLFVGFSFDDENFHRIVHDVRNALPAGSDEAHRQAFGTAVMLHDKRLRRALWRGELKFAVTAGTGSTDGTAARRFEIFLDLLGAHTSTVSSYLLDPAYDELLSQNDRDLRDEFKQVLARVSSHPETEAWRDLIEFAESHGWKPATIAEDPLRRGGKQPRRADPFQFVYANVTRASTRHIAGATCWSTADFERASDREMRYLRPCKMCEAQLEREAKGTVTKKGPVYDNNAILAAASESQTIEELAERSGYKLTPSFRRRVDWLVTKNGLLDERFVRPERRSA